MENLSEISDSVVELPQRLTHTERLSHYQRNCEEKTFREGQIAREQIPLPFTIRDLVILISTYLSYPEMCQWRRTCRHFSYLFDLETVMYPRKTRYLQDHGIDAHHIGSIYQNYRYLRFLKLRSLLHGHIYRLIGRCLDGREHRLARHLIRRELTAYATKKRWREKISYQLVSDEDIIRSTVMGPGGPAFLKEIWTILNRDYYGNYIHGLIEQTVKKENLEMIDFLLSTKIKAITLEKEAIRYNRMVVLEYLLKMRRHHDPSSINPQELLQLALANETSSEPLKYLVDAGWITLPERLGLRSYTHVPYLESLGYSSHYEYGAVVFTRHSESHPTDNNPFI